MSVISHKATRVGFGIQEDQGTPATDPTIIFPLNDGADSPTFNPNRELINYAIGDKPSPYLWYSKGETMEGSLKIPWVPLLMDDGDFYDWLFDRDADTFDGLWGTLWYEFGPDTCKQFSDCKVGGGTVALNYGELVTLAINWSGIKKPIDADPTWPTTEEAYALLSVKPYVFHEAYLQLGPAGAYAAEINTNNHTLEFTNALSDPGDVATLASTESDDVLSAIELPMTEWTRWTVNLDRNFQQTDQALMDAHIDGDEYGYVATLRRAGLATATLCFPRLISTEYSLPIPASGHLKETIAFEALATYANEGLTPNFTLTETAAA